MKYSYIILIGLFLQSNVFSQDKSKILLDSDLEKRLKEIGALKISSEIVQKAKKAQAFAIENSQNWNTNNVFGNVVEKARDVELDKIKGRLTIFISSSMPMSSLQTYAKISERIQPSVMVLKGFIDDPYSIKPTMKFINDTLKKDIFCEENDCAKYSTEVQINPILFRHYNIERTPAFVWEAVAKDTYCEDDLNSKKESELYVLEGDADLIYVLSELYRLTKSSEIKQILSEYENG